MSASCVCGRPSASTYSTPRARPSASVRTRVTRQCVRRSKLPVASASRTLVRPGCHLSPVQEPKPLFHAVYVISG